MTPQNAAGESVLPSDNFKPAAHDFENATYAKVTYATVTWRLMTLLEGPILILAQRALSAPAGGAR